MRAASTISISRRSSRNISTAGIGKRRCRRMCRGAEDDRAMTVMSERIISVVAALIRDSDGRVLLVRKRGTSVFMQPGGKRDAGESDVAALVREIDEELGCRVTGNSARPLGVFDAESANDPGFRVPSAANDVESL